MIKRGARGVVRGNPEAEAKLRQTTFSQYCLTLCIVNKPLSLCHASLSFIHHVLCACHKLATLVNDSWYTAVQPELYHNDVTIMLQLLQGSYKTFYFLVHIHFYGD